MNRLCGDCKHFKAIYAHGKGPGFCGYFTDAYLRWSECDMKCKQWVKADD